MHGAYSVKPRYSSHGWRSLFGPLQTKWIKKNVHILQQFLSVSTAIVSRFQVYGRQNLTNRKTGDVQRNYWQILFKCVFPLYTQETCQDYWNNTYVKWSSHVFWRHGVISSEFSNIFHRDSCQDPAKQQTSECCVHLVALYTYCKMMHGAYSVKSSRNSL